MSIFNFAVFCFVLFCSFDGCHPWEPCHVDRKLHARAFVVEIVWISLPKWTVAVRSRLRLGELIVSGQQELRELMRLCLYLSSAGLLCWWNLRSFTFSHVSFITKQQCLDTWWGGHSNWMNPITVLIYWNVCRGARWAAGHIGNMKWEKRPCWMCLWWRRGKVRSSSTSFRCPLLPPPVVSFAANI